MRIYNHYHKPENYPEFQKRPIRATTRKALADKIQFMSLRALPHAADGTLLDIPESLDLYTKHFDLGKVFWMRANTVTAPNLSAFLDEVVKRDGYVFDLWGFVPGSYKAGVNWGEYTVTENTHKLFTDKLGDHFIGYDNGEQDGRYIGAYARTECPARQSDRYQQRRFYEFFDQMGSQLKHATTALCSLNYCHFFARENNCYMLGAETAQALPNANLWYAYLRGAGKQYGLLWFGNASVYNRFSWKTYEFEDARPDCEGYSYGPTVGTSLSLLRRLMYIEYLYNSDMLGYESGLLTRRKNMETLAGGRPLEMMGGNDDKKTLCDKENSVLSPIGVLQSDAMKFAEARGRAGVMYTPIAVVLASGNGWTMPRHLYSPEVYRVWGQIPYRECDHQLHALFTMLYPGYEDSGFFLGERGFLTPTPYGEMADVLMTDMRPETLPQYNLALLAGWQAFDAEQLDKLSTFAENGGTIIAFAGQLETSDAAALFGLQSLGNAHRRTDERITYAGTARREKAFDVYDEAVLADAEVLSHLDDGTPFITCRTVGKGRALLVLSPFGLDATRSTAPMHNDENKSIPMLYDFTETVKALLADEMNVQRLVNVDNPLLETIVNIRDEHTLTVTVVNNSFTGEYYDLSLRCGRECSRKEIPIPDLDPETPGYYPPYVSPRAPFAHAGEPGVAHLAGAEPAHARAEDRLILGAGQMAMWEFVYEPENVEYVPELPMREMSRNLYVSLRPEGILINELMAMPVLDKYFAGIKLDADYVSDLSLRQAEESGSWLKRRGLGVMVDFSSLLDHYPHMSLIRNMPWKLEKNLRWMDEILEKTAALGAKRILLTTHRNAENHLTGAEAAEDMRTTLSELAKMAETRGLQAIITNGVPRAIDADADALARDYPFLPLAINLGHCLLRGETPLQETLNQAAGLLLSTPLRDSMGQLCDAHMPLRGSAFAEKLSALLAALGLAKYEFICLDGVYDSFNDMYLERKAFLG